MLLDLMYNFIIIQYTKEKKFLTFLKIFIGQKTKLKEQILKFTLKHLSAN